MTWIKLKSDWNCFYRYLSLADIRAGLLSKQNMSKFSPEITSACKEQLTTFASHPNQTHPCLVEVYIRLITSLCFFKIGVKNHTNDCLSPEARLEPYQADADRISDTIFTMKKFCNSQWLNLWLFFYFREWCHWLTLLFSRTLA